LDPLYSSPLPELTPGDIFVNLPSIYLRSAEITFLRRRTGPKGPLADLYILGDEDRAPKKPFNPNDDEVMAHVQLAQAILLTHGCEIDNRPKAALSVAIVRPIKSVPTGDAKEKIRSGENLSYLYLPENDYPTLEQSYVDFSRISALKPEALPLDPRILSASPELLRALYIGLLRYFTRWDIEPELLESLVLDAPKPPPGAAPAPNVTLYPP